MMLSQSYLYDHYLRKEMFMEKNRSLNLKYAGSQIFYFAAFAAMMGYASVFY